VDEPGRGVRDGARKPGIYPVAADQFSREPGPGFARTENDRRAKAKILERHHFGKEQRLSPKRAEGLGKKGRGKLDEREGDQCEAGDEKVATPH
jgi:hypothetical protein